jgi:hypothetical protein
MAQENAPSMLDPILGGGPGVVAVKKDGLLLSALVHIINFIGGSVTVSPPGEGETNWTVNVNAGSAPGWSIANSVLQFPSSIAIGSKFASLANGVITLSVPDATLTESGLLSASEKAVLVAFASASIITKNTESALPGSLQIVVNDTFPDASGLNLEFDADHMYLDAPFLGGTADVGVENYEGSMLSYARGNHVHALSELTVRSVLSGVLADISINGKKLTNVGDPVAPTNAATKAYVDLHSSGVIMHVAVEAMSAANITTMSGLSTAVDACALDTDGKRLLLNGQTTASQNGIWVVHTGAWTRATDLAAGSHAAGAYVLVKAGTLYGGNGWICNTTAGSDVVGTNDIGFVQFTGAATILGGAGMTKTGNTLDVVAGDGSLVVGVDSMVVGVIADAQHGPRGNGTLHTAATTSVAGFMSGADKTKLNGIESGANATGDATAIAKGSVQLTGDIAGAAASPTVVGITGTAGTANVTATTILFDAANTTRIISQAQVTTGNGGQLEVRAQNATEAGSLGGVLALRGGFGGNANAGKLGYGGDVQLYAATSVLVADFGIDETQIKSDSIRHANFINSEQHVLSRMGAFAVKEDVIWLRVTTSSLTPFNFDITSVCSSAGIDDNKTYQVDYIIQATGGTNSSIRCVGMFMKSGGFVSAAGPTVTLNTNSNTVTVSASGSNTLRLSVTPLSATSTVWTAKIHVIEV